MALRESLTTRQNFLEYLRGKRSGASVIRSAKNAVAEYGPACKDCTRMFAHRQEDNADRDLLRFKFPESESVPIPEIAYIDLPVRADNDIGVTWVKHPLLFPHEWLHALYKDQWAWRHLALGPPGELERFWENEAKSAVEHRHPVVKDGSYLQHTTVPFVIHGDDAGVGRKTKLFILSMHSPLPHCNNSDNFLLLSCVAGADIIPGLTLETLYQEIVHSFNEGLSCGMWYRCDPRGDVLDGWRGRVNIVPLAAGARGAFSFSEGDWKWHKEAWNIRAYASHNCCGSCGASKVVQSQTSGGGVALAGAVLVS